MCFHNWTVAWYTVLRYGGAAAFSVALVPSITTKLFSTPPPPPQSLYKPSTKYTKKSTRIGEIREKSRQKTVSFSLFLLSVHGTHWEPRQELHAYPGRKWSRPLEHSLCAIGWDVRSRRCAATAAFGVEREEWLVVTYQTEQHQLLLCFSLVFSPCVFTAGRDCASIGWTVLPRLASRAV